MTAEKLRALGHPLAHKMYDQALDRRTQTLIEKSKERAARAMERGCPKCGAGPNRSCVTPLGIPLSLPQGWIHDERHEPTGGAR